MKKTHTIYENWIDQKEGFNALLVLVFMFYTSLASAADSYVSTTSKAEWFSLVAEGKVAPLFVSSEDFTGVLKVARHLQADIERVTGIAPKILTDEPGSGKTLVIIGTIGKNPVIDQLIRENKINANEVAGRWDTFALQTVKNPLPGVAQSVPTGSGLLVCTGREA